MNEEKPVAEECKIFGHVFVWDGAKTKCAVCGKRRNEMVVGDHWCYANEAVKFILNEDGASFLG